MITGSKELATDYLFRNNPILKQCNNDIEQTELLRSFDQASSAHESGTFNIEESF
jgi:hypothetical protein